MIQEINDLLDAAEAHPDPAEALRQATALLRRTAQMASGLPSPPTPVAPAVRRPGGRPNRDGDPQCAARSAKTGRKCQSRILVSGTPYCRQHQPVAAPAPPDDPEPESDDDDESDPVVRRAMEALVELGLERGDDVHVSGIVIAPPPEPESDPEAELESVSEAGYQLIADVRAGLMVSAPPDAPLKPPPPLVTKDDLRNLPVYDDATHVASPEPPPFPDAEPEPDQPVNAMPDKCPNCGAARVAFMSDDAGTRCRICGKRVV